MRPLSSFAVVLVLLLSACVSHTGSVPPVTVLPVPPVALSQNGYQFLPLDEKGWILDSRNAEQVRLFLKGDRPGESHSIQAELIELPTFQDSLEMMTWIRQEQHNEAGSLPFIIQKHKAWSVDFGDQLCVRSLLTARDVEPEENGITITTNIYGITCPHPFNPQIGVYLIIGQRHEPGHEDALLQKKAETLFRSLEFTPFLQETRSKP